MIDRPVALEVQKLETRAWRDEALRSRGIIAEQERALMIYGGWMGRYIEWRRRRKGVA